MTGDASSTRVDAARLDWQVARGVDAAAAVANVGPARAMLLVELGEDRLARWIVEAVVVAELPLSSWGRA